MQLDRLNTYDLEELERVKHPTQEMLLALIKKLHVIKDEKNNTQLKLDSLEETLMEAEIDL